jgi:hypothetical protein
VNATPGAEGPIEPPDIAAARERLREEIERVRAGVEQMLTDHDSEGSADLRHELERLRIDGRRYAKRRVGRSERRFERSLDRMDRRVRDLEFRFQSFEQERHFSEWRIQTNTERLLDGLLREVRGLADLMARTR